MKSVDWHRLGPAEEAALEATTVQAMRASGVDPAMVYAYERTHLIVAGDARDTNPAELDEWEDAIAEYRERHPTN